MAKSSAVVYYSKHGTAKEYAEWIAEETGSVLLDGSQIKYRDLEPYDILIIGGGIYSGGIQGREFIQKAMKKKKWKDKLVLAFGVGITVDDEANRAQADEINFPRWAAYVPCWYLPGRYDPSEIKGLDKQIMSITRKMIEGGNANAFGRTLLGYIDNGCDLRDRTRIAPLVEEIRRIQADDTITRQAQIAPPDAAQREASYESLLDKFRKMI